MYIDLRTLFLMKISISAENESKYQRYSAQKWYEEKAAIFVFPHGLYRHVDPPDCLLRLVFVLPYACAQVIQVSSAFVDQHIHLFHLGFYVLHTVVHISSPLIHGVLVILYEIGSCLIRNCGWISVKFSLFYLLLLVSKSLGQACL